MTKRHPVSGKAVSKTRHFHDHDHHHPHECEASAPDGDADRPIAANGLSWHVSGMDCASCAATITHALNRLPGVKHVHVSIISETLTLQLDEQQTPRPEIEKTIAALGYKAQSLQAEKPAVQKEPDQRWWQTSKGQAVILSGILLATAFLISLAWPQGREIVFASAALVSLLPVSRHAFAALKHGSPFTIEMLMTIAAVGALFIHAAEEAAMVVFLFNIGEMLEGVAAGRARAGIRALDALAPKTAWRERDGRLQEVSIDDLAIGDIILARSGDRIAADGQVVDGLSSVNEAPVTGESLPRPKRQGDTVYAGTINLEAPLRLRVEKTAADNTIARIIKLVETAETAKAPTERFIDNFSRYYMPVIVGIALLTALIPPLVFAAGWATWLYRALALLLIGCPCALVISVPAAIAASLANGARHGLLVKGGQVIETLAAVRTIAFDKTGTLTTGTLTVSDVIPFNGKAETLLALAYSVEQESSHPLAAAIVAHAQAANIPARKAGHIQTIAGKGMTATIAGKKVFIGAPRFAADYGMIVAAEQARINQLEDQGKTVVVVMKGGIAAGGIALGDMPREDAKPAITALHRLGVETIMMTGDNKRAASAIAEKLDMQAQAELLPEMKADFIGKLAQEKPVGMVGDGINDAPALARANVGIAMGAGTDVALETADAALLRNRVGDVAALIKLARDTMRNIKQNITIALGLKLVFLITTLLGITGLWPAIFADTGATVLVTINALRLLGQKIYES
ncbi:MAG: Heavy metal translocating P-type ATPase [Candidatus Tokpelaia hoelldobleri]|uniref:P-type Zn(2+) transporter n=1 Tax=Candidatus Tokpelaia hoelldobleri TaxID=1902579 RepID=A0A1U9JV98_9HYPH|nr:MAG: Heavy metal translocating P-type ATPase [Candidatus Tokpelaia hoelldoblerii]